MLLRAPTAVPPSMAATLAGQAGRGGFQNSNYGSNITLGWGFSLVNAVTVTGLGYFDGNGGFTGVHPVGIWNSIGILLSAATVPSGATAGLLRGLRLRLVPPAILGRCAASGGAFSNPTSPD